MARLFRNRRVWLVRYPDRVTFDALIPMPNADLYRSTVLSDAIAVLERNVECFGTKRFDGYINWHEDFFAGFDDAVLSFCIQRAGKYLAQNVIEDFIQAPEEFFWYLL